ncbi:MAG: hypothetical protein AOA65_2247 [Candidatus Bathyarchaeota archaeon BA1]|nr:MAG: hypothetical protein AOA65_2247 [Candidatus Bathyarchaeota archaeon BA1]
MSIVTLLEKVYGPFRPETFETSFKSLCGGLKVSLRVVGKTNRGWIQIEISGEDETAALHYLNQRVGLAPATIDKLKKFFTTRGRVIFSRRSGNELYVDMGVFYPKKYDAAIPLRSLQAQLADGKSLSLQRVIKLFCLYDNLPLMVKIIGNVDVQNEGIEAELSEAQLSQFTRWIRSRLDRLIIIGASRSDVERVLKASKHTRDIVEVESLGLLEHAIACKLGTDAVGLIPKLGSLLPTTTLTPFCPREIQHYCK